MFSQADPALLTQLIANLGSAGLIAWWCWYTTTTTIPAITAAFQAEARATRAEAQLSRDAMHDALDRIIAAHDASTRSLADALHDLSTATIRAAPYAHAATTD